MNEGLQEAVVAHGNLVKNKSKQRGKLKRAVEKLLLTLQTCSLHTPSVTALIRTSLGKTTSLLRFSLSSPLCQWKKHSCVYQRAVPPAGLPRSNPLTPYPLKTTPLSSSSSLSLPASNSPSIQEYTYQHPDMLQYSPSHKTKKPTNQPKNPYAWTSPSSLYPIFLVSFMEKLLKRVIPTCFKWNRACQPTFACFLESASPGRSVHTPLFFLTSLAASLLEVWRGSFLGSFLSSLVTSSPQVLHAIHIVMILLINFYICASNFLLSFRCR